MKLTPVDILRREFRRKAFHGLDPEDVEQFLCEVAEGVETLLAENAALRRQLASASPSNEAAELLRTREEARLLLDVARKEAQQILAQARAEAERIHREAQPNPLRSHIREYLRLLEEHLRQVQRFLETPENHGTEKHS